MQGKRSLLIIPLIVASVLGSILLVIPKLIPASTKINATTASRQPMLNATEMTEHFPEVYYLSDAGPATLVFVVDVYNSLGMGWGYNLHCTIQSVIEGAKSWEGQQIWVSVYTSTFDDLLLPDGKIRTPLLMGFRELPDFPGGAVPQFTDQDGKHWKLLYIYGDKVGADGT